MLLPTITCGQQVGESNALFTPVIVLNCWAICSTWVLISGGSVPYSREELCRKTEEGGSGQSWMTEGGSDRQTDRSCLFLIDLPNAWFLLTWYISPIENLWRVLVGPVSLLYLKLAKVSGALDRKYLREA